jgi:4-amino-4-deoxy-L-arabinose transferase-like glycosyltransferase
MRSHSFYALCLFFFALVIRLVFLTATYPDKDRVGYMEDVGIAINLLEGKGYVYHFSGFYGNVPLRPTALKPPVYPILVFLVFFIFGMKNFFALFVIHALLAAFTCALLYLTIAKFSHYRAAIAGLAFALYPPFIYHSVAIPESTTATLFLISLFCYGLVNLYERFGQKRWVLVAIVTGLLAMTEPVTIPFIFFALLYVAYLTVDSWKKISLEMFIAVLVFAATIAPWTLRNYLTFKQFVFIKSNFGTTLWVIMGHRLPIAKEKSLSLAREAQGMDEVNEDKAVKNAMLSWILENPSAYLRLLPKNFENFWWEIDRYKNNPSTSFIVGRRVPYILLLIFAIPAMFWRLIQIGTKGELRHNSSMYHHLMLILILTYTAIYTVIGSVNLRYHFPVEFGMFIFCTDTVLYIVNKIRLPSTKSLHWLEARS